MTSTEKKAYLSRYRQLERQEAALWQEYKAARMRYDSLRSPAYDGMPHSGTGDPTAITAIRLAADRLEEKILEMIEAKRQAREEIRQAIEALPNEAEKTVLYWRYIGGLTWEEVAVKCAYTYRHTLRLHGYALKHFMGEL